MDRLKRLFENNTSAISSLRGLVNRKLGGKDISIEDTTPTGIDDGFDELRKLNKERKP